MPQNLKQHVGIFPREKKYIPVYTHTFYFFLQDQWSSGVYSHLSQPEAKTGWSVQCMNT